MAQESNAIVAELVETELVEVRAPLAADYIPPEPQDRWRNRIVGTGVERAGDLAANPKNWKIHTHRQEFTMRGILETVGWVQTVIVNRPTGFLVDGHMRILIALQEGDDTAVPVSYVDLTQEEEDLILATFDPIAALAATDRDQLQNLLSGIRVQDERVHGLLAHVAEGEKLRIAGLNARLGEGNALPFALGDGAGDDDDDDFDDDGPDSGDRPPLRLLEGGAGGGSALALGGMGAGAAPPQAVRMVQLFLTVQTHPQFMEWIEGLEGHFGTNNVTDTVWKAVEYAFDNLV